MIWLVILNITFHSVFLNIESQNVPSWFSNVYYPTLQYPSANLLQNSGKFYIDISCVSQKLKNVLSSSLILDKRNIKKTTPAFISLVQTIFILTVVSTRQFSGDRTPWGFSVISGQIIWYVAMEAIWYICKINTSEIWQIPISGHLDICDNTQFNKFSFYKLLGEVMFKVEKKKVELGRIIMSVPR